MSHERSPGTERSTPKTASVDDDAAKLEQLRAEIQKGLDDEAAGRVVDGKEVFRRLRARYK